MLLVGFTLWVPLVAFVPVQPLLAVQLIAPVLLQVSALACPLVTLVGFAVSVAVGVLHEFVVHVALQVFGHAPLLAPVSHCSPAS